MSELDEVWLEMLAQAKARAETAGRAEIADYLALKSSNDFLRSAGCQWLFDSFLELSEAANRKGIRLEIESESPHSFIVGHSTMVGSLLRFRYGVRCLTIETGWTRTPRDGFMRGGALARARVSHFGIREQNVELMLLRNKNAAPFWVVIRRGGAVKAISVEDLEKYFRIFLAIGS